MNAKSFVTMEQNICPVCGITFETGNILMDKRLKESFENKTITGYSLCEEHKELYSKGYIALVGIDENKSKTFNGSYKLEDVYRTGKIVHIKSSAFPGLFNQPAPETPFVFTSDEVITKLEEIA
jgi:hypothetical protein